MSRASPLGCPGPDAPFSDFAGPPAPAGALRSRIRAAHRLPEPECLPPLLAAAAQGPAEDAAATDLARRLVRALRAKGRSGPVAEMMREFSLSSTEGVALMCLAEALLRIPDAETRDALIRDKLGQGNWEAHLGHGGSIFASAAIWGLVVTGRVVAVTDEAGLSAVLARLVRRAGEPVIRKGVDLGMRMLGGQFVSGRSIGEALENGRRLEAKGFTYSYDMLGEAAVTEGDAARYRADYATAIGAIGAASAGRGPLSGPGISIKLSALHPRYARSQRGRVMAELLPHLTDLALAARRQDIGLNIDAEEADRLDLSLDLLEALSLDPRLAGWDGLGFVVQAYQKRALPVLDWLVDLARRSRRRLMVRLVKGAYWDTEIKRAQVDGLDGFPVFTRKIHTDVSYLACARRMLAAGDAVFPQFATHNARTLADIVAMAGPDFRPGDYEFQCLHGMGEALYREVVGGASIDRPCRIYAPVGTHETLLAYLVRRLLENGANSSFVNRIADPSVPVDDLVASPVDRAGRIDPPGSPHPGIALPHDLFGDERRNARGLDLADDAVLAALGPSLIEAAAVDFTCRPVVGDRRDGGTGRPIRNPARRDDVVGRVVEADDAAVEQALGEARAAFPAWAAIPAPDRAAILARAADGIEAERAAFLGLLVREAGKSPANAVSEIREAVDFLRYYGAQAARFEPGTHRPLGPVACISPWNFPLAIFLGQVAAALAAGNTVLAKPAEETPLVAGLAVEILRRAGIPAGALALLPGDGRVGAQLVADPRICGVIFTGSTEVARAIQGTLAGRLGPEGRPVPLIAETGGQNALVVDSSALPEQVVADVLASAFDSAGQRCSALRVLCLQEDGADRILAMLEGAMAELSIGDPDRIATDVGPVISAEARASIEAHVARMEDRGHAVHRVPLPPACAGGHFVAPTLIAIDSLEDLDGEVFGPVLHVLRYQRDGLDALVAAINATGYGLTFGVHSRIDATVAQLAERVRAGNIYVNRNLIGAVVGVQPFGGEGLSGTGPKAGGPLYLRRLLAAAPTATGLGPTREAMPELVLLRDAMRMAGRDDDAARCEAYAAQSLLGLDRALPGPVGESNRYSLHPRGRVLGLPATRAGLIAQVAAALATGNAIRLHLPDGLAHILDGVPEPVRALVEVSAEAEAAGCAAFLVEGDRDAVLAATRLAAALPGAIVPVFAVSPQGLAEGREAYRLDGLLRERSLSIDTSAAGGNAALMTLRE